MLFWQNHIMKDAIRSRNAKWSDQNFAGQKPNPLDKAIEQTVTVPKNYLEFELK